MPVSSPSPLDEVAYRPAVADDFKFIFDSWLTSWRKSPWAGCIPNNLYFDLTRRAIEQLVARGAVFLVACQAQSPSRILGWCCTELSTDPEPLTIAHYLYVKDPYVTLGIGAELVKRTAGAKPGFYTHRYRQVIDACPQFRHAPEIARRR